VNERFKIIRKTLKYKQEDFAIILNTNQQGISDIENEKKQIPFEIIEFLGTRYNINLNWLILGIGNMYMEYQRDYSIANEPHAKYGEDNITSLQKEIERKDTIINSLIDQIQLLKLKLNN